MSESPIEDPGSSSFSFEDSPTLFLFTSLTAGSSHIITATSRLETILKANRIPFRAIDIATNEKARRIWGRRAGKRKLPGLVREGWVLADKEEAEEWNEYGELKEQLAAATGTGFDSGPGSGVGTGVTTPTTSAPPTIGSTSQSHPQKDSNVPTTGITTTLPIREQLPKQTEASPTATTTTSSKPTSINIQPADPSTLRVDTSSPMPAREDLDDIVSPSDTGAKSPHNTSYITSLPPLRIPSGTPKPPDMTKSPNFPDPPPPTAVGPNDLSISHGLPPGGPSDAAGPASKSGLDAVFSDPKSSDAVATMQQTESVTGGRGRSSDRDVMEAKKRNTVSDEDAEDLRSPSHAKGAPGAKVKFTEDQLKGDPRDGRSAEDSVGD